MRLDRATSACRELVGFDEAVGLVARVAPLCRTERIALADAGGRRLAAPVRARRDAPAIDVAAMDGFAVRDADLGGDWNALSLIGEAVAGRGFEGALATGACVRIATGAPTPAGTDRVVMHEQVRLRGTQVLAPNCAGEKRHVRRAGSDFRQGEVLVEPGRILTAGRLMAVAAADLAHVEVFRRPQIAILATGDELAAPGGATTLGATPDSVSHGVAELARNHGAEIVIRRRLPDDLPRLQAAAAQTVADVDLIVVVGGASTGPRDYARAMFGALGLELAFSKVAMKPGKPVWFGRSAGTLILGLPGNPTAALLTARLFLSPLLAALSGCDPTAASSWVVRTLGCALAASGDSDSFVPSRISRGLLEPFANRDSSGQKGLATIDAIVRRRPLAPALDPGAPVKALML